MKSEQKINQPSRFNQETTEVINTLAVFFRYFEYILLTGYFGFIIYLFTNLSCNNNSCELANQSNGFGAIIIGYLIFALSVILTVRTTLNYIRQYSIDPSRDYDYLYIVSVVSQTISFFLIGFFLPQLLIRSESGVIDFTIFLMFLISIGVSIISILFDKSFWESNFRFIKVRLLSTLVLILLLFFNPILGLFGSILILPLMVLFLENV